MMANKEVIFQPFPKQEELITAAISGKYSVIGFGGGIRGGKTFASLWALVLLARIYPYSRWVVVRKTLTILRDTTIKSYHGMGIGAFQENYNQQTQTITFTNGSEIVFFGENFEDDKELNRWKGLECNGFLLEEGNELQEASFYKAVERAGSHIPKHKGKALKKPPPLIMVTCNPSQGWVKKLLYNPWRDNTLHEDWLFIPALVTDNPAMANDEKYMQALKRMPKMYYDVYVLGDWDMVANERPWLHAFIEAEHVRPVPFMKKQPVYLAFDFNADPVTCTAWQMSPIMGGTGAFLHGIREFGGKMKIDELCVQIRAAFPYSVLYVCGDRSGQSQDVGRHQTLYQMIQGFLKLSDKQMVLNTHNLEHADSRMLCNSIFEYYPILIDPCMKNLIADCRKAETDPNSKHGNVLRKDRGEFKMDYFDSMRYLFQTFYLNYMKEEHLHDVWELAHNL